MKGTCQRAIKEAAERVRMAIEGLASRSSSEETRRLHLENDRLRKELGALRKEMKSFREEVRSIGGQPLELTQPHSRAVRPSIVESPSSDELLRAAVSKIGKMMDARFAGIEDRFLPPRNSRPPLAADVRNAARNTAITSRGTKKPSMASREALQAASQVVSQAAKTQQSAPPPNRNVPTTEEPDPIPLASANDGWQTAAKKKRGMKKKKPPAPNTVASGSNRREKRQLRSPKSAAVVLTLQPEVVQKGLTYVAVISRAKESVNLADLGITDIRFRQAATGARLLEFPGTDGTKRADLIAEKLRGIMAEDVKVSRPTKCAEMRIYGLDDSITKRDVQEAIAQKTGCSAEVVRVGPIRLGPEGVESAWAQCPVQATKQIADAGRLLVGWSSARVRILEARPMICFKCMERGNTRHKCTSGTDLSGHCFRCAKPEHLAATCSADPHCPLCEMAMLPANHVVGSKAASRQPLQIDPGRFECGATGTVARGSNDCGLTMDSVRNHCLLQTNLNHSAAAQNLLLQSMAEWSIDVAVAVEPYFGQPRPDWVGDVDGSVVIIGSTASNCLPLSFRERGPGYVAVARGNIILFGVYFSQNRSLAEFEDFLDRLGTSVRRMTPDHIMIMGDFNAKSIAWGSSRTDARGEAVEEWAVAAGLCLLNRGSTITCVRQQGGTIVDLSFATPAVATRVQG